MENNEYYTLDYTEEAENCLLFNAYKQLPSAINKGELKLYIIVNKTKKQFWINCESQLNHAKNMTKIHQTTLNNIREWHKK
ncbi:hypothetical protein [Myroides sp. LoEW2-1]|uniref:hypothetical protein n=1 Tax=Myroides sp. LoEW2-1 TaxID=2683192 RepID=UPI00132654B4|nr:hypothetical protein [Myroides sp. LoEW2-1]MVX36970.1 hypothetical protein [Myroides sp. LoEW2-1]